MLKVTRDDIVKVYPSAHYWSKVHYDNNNQVSLESILETNGLEDAVRSAQAIGNDKLLRMFACRCAESVVSQFEKKFPGDNRPRKAIEAAREFIHGKISELALATAGDAAMDVAWDNRDNPISYAADASAWATAHDGCKAAYEAFAYAKKLEGSEKVLSLEFLKLCRIEGEYALYK